MTLDLINRVSRVNQPLTPLASDLLFSTNFAGAISLSPSSSSSIFVGTDSETGQLFPLNNGTNQGDMGLLLAEIIRIANGAVAADIAADQNAYGYAAIQDTTGPDGTTEKELYLELRDSGLIKQGVNAAWGGQIDLNFQRITTGTNVAALADLDNIYCSYYFKRPSALAASMAVGDNVAQFDFKTGGYNGQYGGSFRIVGALTKRADGNLYSYVWADRNANSAPSAAPDGILPFPNGSGAFWYWRDWDKATAIPLNAWNKIEVFVHKHNSRGLCVVAYNDVIVCAHVGRTRSEYADLYGEDWGRMFPFLIYSGNTLGTPGQTSGSIVRLRWHDYPPVGSVLQSPVAEHINKYAA